MSSYLLTILHAEFANFQTGLVDFTKAVLTILHEEFANFQIGFVDFTKAVLTILHAEFANFQIGLVDFTKAVNTNNVLYAPTYVQPTTTPLYARFHLSSFMICITAFCSVLNMCFH